MSFSRRNFEGNQVLKSMDGKKKPAVFPHDILHVEKAPSKSRKTPQCISFLSNRSYLWVPTNMGHQNNFVQIIPPWCSPKAEEANANGRIVARQIIHLTRQKPAIWLPMGKPDELPKRFNAAGNLEKSHGSNNDAFQNGKRGAQILASL
jgi:hypothetical protein